jgi:hypothetical protein
MPDYLNAGFYRKGKFIAIKENQIYKYDGKHTSPYSIQSMFINYPIIKNTMAQVDADSTKEQILEDSIFQHEKEIQRRNSKLMKRGEEALAMSQQVINDQDAIYHKNKNSIGNLDKSNYSNQRQVSITEDDDRIHRAKIFYLRSILTFVVIEIIVYFVFQLLSKNLTGSSTIVKVLRKIVDNRKLLLLVVTGIFLCKMITRFLGDLKMSRMRWGLKQWVQPFPEDDVEVNDDNLDNQTSHGDQKSSPHLKKRCKNLDNHKTHQPHQPHQPHQLHQPHQPHQPHITTEQPKSSGSFGMSLGNGSEKHSHKIDASTSLSL